MKMLNRDYRGFIAPKVISPFFRDVKRLSRKVKKQFRKEVPEYVWKSSTLDLGQQLWYWLYLRNPKYNAFLISKVCELYE
jgi:hypothetical protein